MVCLDFPLLFGHTTARVVPLVRFYLTGAVYVVVNESGRLPAFTGFLVAFILHHHVQRWRLFLLLLPPPSLQLFAFAKT